MAEERNAHMMSQLMSKIDNLSEQVTTLGHRISAIEKNVDQATTYNIVEQARHGIAFLVRFNHAFNMTFYGLPQKPGMSLEETFRNFMVDTLNIKQDRANNMPIYVQQIGKLSPQHTCAPVCVSFCAWDDIMLIQTPMKKIGSKLKKDGIWAEWMRDPAVMVKTSYD